MRYAVVMTGRAERDLLAAAQWWGERRSLAQADRWLAAIQKKIESLATSPLRYALARESDRFSIANLVWSNLAYYIASRRAERLSAAIATKKGRRAAWGGRVSGQSRLAAPRHFC